MKKTVAIILIIVMALSLCACGAKEEAAPATLGQQLYHEFNAKVEGGEKDVQALADALLQSGMLPFDGLSMEVEPGWLMGFTADIEGFEKGVMFGPAIGAIPFVGYVFTVEGDADAFAANLESLCDLRWNICTEAEEAVAGVAGNKVFFVMSNKSFDA